MCGWLQRKVQRPSIQSTHLFWRFVCCCINTVHSPKKFFLILFLNLLNIFSYSTQVWQPDHCVKKNTPLNLGSLHSFTIALDGCSSVWLKRKAHPVDANFMYVLRVEKSLPAVFNFEHAICDSVWTEGLLYLALTAKCCLAHAIILLCKCYRRCMHLFICNFLSLLLCLLHKHSPTQVIYSGAVCNMHSP